MEFDLINFLVGLFWILVGILIFDFTPNKRGWTPWQKYTHSKRQMSGILSFFLGIITLIGGCDWNFIRNWFYPS